MCAYRGVNNCKEIVFNYVNRDAFQELKHITTSVNMIADLNGVKDYLYECLNKDKSVYEYTKMLFTWPYSGFDCETLNDYARLECIKWMINEVSNTYYVNKSCIYATWFMVREVSMNLKTLIDTWWKDKESVRDLLDNDFKKMFEQDPCEFSKCLNSYGFASLSNHMRDILEKVYDNPANATIVDTSMCIYYVNRT